MGKEIRPPPLNRRVFLEAVRPMQVWDEFAYDAIDISLDERVGYLYELDQRGMHEYAFILSVGAGFFFECQDHKEKYRFIGRVRRDMRWLRQRVSTSSSVPLEVDKEVDTMLKDWEKTLQFLERRGSPPSGSLLDFGLRRR